MLNCQRARALHRERSAYGSLPPFHQATGVFWYGPATNPLLLKMFNKWRAPRRQRLYLRRWPRHDASLHLFPAFLRNSDGRSSCLWPTTDVLFLVVIVQLKFVCCVLCVPWFLLDFYFCRWACFLSFNLFSTSVCLRGHETPETPVRLGHVVPLVVLFAVRTLCVSVLRCHRRRFMRKNRGKFVMLGYVLLAKQKQANKKLFDRRKINNQTTVE